MSDLSQKPTDVDRQAAVGAHGAVDNLEIKHEKPDEFTLREFVDCGALVKQEHWIGLSIPKHEFGDGGCTEICQNVLLSIKCETRSESPEMDHQRDCHVDTPATITDFSFKEESPGNMKTYSKPEPSQAAVSLTADSAVTLDKSMAKEHTTTEDSKMDEVFSVKQNCFKPRTQQTLTKDKNTDNRETNREDSAQDGSVVRRVDTHTGETLFSCHHCSYKAGYKSHLVKHMRTHTGEKLWCCKYCDYECLYPSALNTHMRTHTGENPYSCKYCDYKCSLAHHLKSHMRTHTGEKPLSCECCDYKCSRASDLKRHMITHTGEKPHSCKYCDYKCSQASHLKNHMRTHTGEKPHSCEYCDYKCSISSALKRHMRAHTGEKPHCCEYCDYKTSRASSLKSHMKTQHK